MQITKINPATRLSGVHASAMRELFEIANQMRAEGKRVIDFGLGDIDIPLPQPVLDGIKQAIDDGKTKYGPNQGEYPLREKICQKYKEQHNLDISSEDVLITSGSLESLMDIALAYINPGDEVIIAEPEFPYFGYQVILAGGKVVPLPTQYENYFVPDSDRLNELITDKTKAILINYPNNPTSAVLESKDFEKIIEIARDNNLLLISDEAYERITFDDFEHKSAIDYNYENTLVVNSASKSLCMTGLRVGFTVTTNTELLKPVSQIHQYNTAHAAVNNQYGVISGLEYEDQIIKNSTEILQKRRDVMLETWNDIPGLDIEMPRGAFYLYPNVEGTEMTGEEFSKFALEQGVVVTPGNTFCFDKDSKAGTEHVRASFGITSEEEIKEAAEMLISGLNDR